MPRRAVASIRWVDGAVALAVLIVLLGAMTAGIRSPGDRDPTGLAYLLAVLLAGLTLVRRLQPIAVLVATTAVLLAYYMSGFPPVGFALPVAAALYAVADTGRWRFAAGWSIALLLATYAYRFVIADQGAAYLFGFELPTSAAVMAGAVALGVAAHTRRELRAEQERVLAGVRREEAQAAAQRVEQERLLLARDLHDVLAHTVSVVGLHADVADEALDDGDAKAARAAVRAIREASSTAMRDLRGTLQVLRGTAPASLHPTAGLEALPALVNRARVAGMRVDCATDLPRELPSAVGVTVYRVMQEAVTNSLRHSGATALDLRIHAVESAVVVRVEDDGAGADGGALTQGHGLRGMTERVQLLGGSVEVGNRAGRGFFVHARIPT